MNLKTKTAAQLVRMIRRGPALGKAAALEWAERIERQDQPRCCLPKKQQRQLALLPPINHEPTTSQTSPKILPFSAQNA